MLSETCASIGVISRHLGLSRYQLGISESLRACLDCLKDAVISVTQLAHVRFGSESPIPPAKHLVDL
jgi:hypothetical protein